MRDMKRIIALIAIAALVLSFAGCGAKTASTADEASSADVSSYDNNFEGLTEYVAGRTPGSSKNDLYYDLLGADDGVRFVLSASGSPYIEVYDFSSTVDSAATADEAKSEPADADSHEKAKEILKSIADTGKFSPLEGVTMTAVVTDSGRYVLAWDDSRNFDYTGKIATDDMKAYW